MIAQVLLPAGLAAIGGVVGLGLRPADFARLVSEPRAMLVGVAAQMLLLPLLAVAILAVAPLPGPFAVGLVVLAACPGGITSHLLTLLARGDVALAVSITAVTNTASTVTLPLVVTLATGRFLGASADIAIPVGPTMAGVFLVSALPLALGMLARARFPAGAARAEPALRRLAVTVFVAIVAHTFLGQTDAFAEHAAAVGPRVVALNVTAMAIAHTLARAAATGDARAVAITVECGLQNAAMAIFVATTLLGRPDIAVPAVLYALTMNLSALALVAARRRAPRPQEL